MDILEQPGWILSSSGYRMIYQIHYKGTLTMKFSQTLLITMAMMTGSCQLAAMESSQQNKEIGQELIQDINTLKPYYNAIQQIRIALDAVAKKANCSTKFYIDSL